MKTPLAPKKRKWVGKRTVTLVGTPLNHNVSAQLRYKAAILKLVREMAATTKREISALFDTRVAEKFIEQQAEAAAMDSTPSITSKAKRSMALLVDRFTDLFQMKSTKLAAKMLEDVDDTSARRMGTSLEQLTGGLLLDTSIVPEGMAQVSAAIIEENVNYIESIPAQYFSQINGAVMRSITTGNGLQDLIPAIAKIDGVTQRRAKNIAIDQTRKAYNMINKQRLQANGVKQFRWLHSQGGAHPRQSHLKISGMVFSFENIINEQIAAGVTDPYDQGLPSIPPNCFPGSTIVSLANGCGNLWRYWYVGDLISLQLQDGASIECTPNHPILTLRGWVPANEIQQGDYLVSSKSDNASVIDHEAANGKTTFKELFDSLSATEAITISPGSEFNFHGDTPEHKVDAIRVDNKLPDWRVSITAEHFEKLVLSFADVMTNSFFIGFSPQVIELSVSSVFGYRLAFIDGKFSHTYTVRLASITQEITAFLNDGSDTFAPDVVFNGKCQNAIAGNIGVDDISSASMGIIDPSSVGDGIIESLSQGGNEMAGASAVEADKLFNLHPAFKKLLRVNEKIVSVFAGHVYTLESFNGWYTVTPADIVSKNCGCRFVPILNFGDL